MQQFMRKFEILNGSTTKILLEHCLFGKQVHYCDCTQIVNDAERLGIVIKGQEIFLYKQHIILAKTHDNLFIFSDGKLQITIIVNKL